MAQPFKKQNIGVGGATVRQPTLSPLSLKAFSNKGPTVQVTKKPLVVGRGCKSCGR